MNKQIHVTKTMMETLQWFIFLLAGSIALPIVIGSVFELNFSEVAGLMQRTFFVVGLASMLQAVIGHRLPIMEGPAGIWVSIFTVMAISGGQQGINSGETLRTLETTMIMTGVFLCIFGVFKVAQKILPIFTPLVIGTFFILLTVQLSGTFLQGMLGIQQGTTAIQLVDTILAFITFFVVLGLSIFGRGWLSGYAVLIGIVIGWVMYLVFVGNGPSISSVSVFSVPDWFVWGVPTLDFSVIPIAFITAVILLSNVVASVVAVSQSMDRKSTYTNEQINHGSSVLGINHGLSGVFASIANVPVAISAGFIRLTGQKERNPFIFASILLVIVSFFPPVVSFVSGIPSPIANAAIMATFVQLVVLAITNLTAEKIDSRRGTMIGVAYLIGIGTMFLPSEVFAELPGMVQNLASNGLLVGTTLVIVMEQLWRVKE